MLADASLTRLLMFFSKHIVSSTLVSELSTNNRSVVKQDVSIDFSGLDYLVLYPTKGQHIGDRCEFMSDINTD